MKRFRVRSTDMSCSVKVSDGANEATPGVRLSLHQARACRWPPTSWPWALGVKLRVGAQNDEAMRCVVGDRSTVAADAERDSVPKEPAGIPRRLVVELNSYSSKDLAELVELEELNKTTIVNRALQLYAMMRRTELGGGRIYIQDSEADELQRLRII